jgi:hypothetical protein
MLFNEIIPVYTEKHFKAINTKCIKHVEHIIPTGLESVKLATVTTMKETINIKK